MAGINDFSNEGSDNSAGGENQINAPAVNFDNSIASSMTDNTAASHLPTFESQFAKTSWANGPENAAVQADAARLASAMPFTPAYSQMTKSA